MNHGIKTIVITTTEQANAMLEYLDNQRQAAQQDDYATERAKPIKWLSCTCCGESFQGRDWWNMEPGYGICDECAAKWAVSVPGNEDETYGVCGVHYLIPQEQRENPPVVVDRGQPYLGLDERLRIEYDGYVYWRGIQIEHYSGSLLADSDHSRQQGLELIRRCEILESRGEEISSTNVIWRWEQ